MPVYEYRCKQCGKHHEIHHGYHDERPTLCPSCGGHLVRVFHPVGVVFKGSGFHKTDYTSSGARKERAETGESKASSDGKAGEAKPGEAKAPDAKSEPKGDIKPKSEEKPARSTGGSRKQGSSQ